MAYFATSYMRTGGARVTRNTDSVVYPFNARQQAMTAYARFFMLDTDTPATRILWQVSDGATNNPRWRVYMDSGGNWTHDFHNGWSGALATVASTATFGAIVEVRAALDAGTMVVGQSVNGAAEVTGSVAAPGFRNLDFSAQQIYVHGIAGAFGMTHLLTHFVTGRGVLSRASCRALAGIG